MRERFVTDLVRDLLGPRNGPWEVLSTSPLTEYITGVLAPATARAGVPEPDAEPVFLSGPEDGFAADLDVEEPDEDVVPPPLLVPSLDPQSRPASFGISFRVTAENGKPRADVCITWGRYVAEREGERMIWKRHPRAAVLSLDLDRDRVVHLDAEGRQAPSGNAEVALHLISRRLDDCWLVNIYLLNCISPPSDRAPGAEQHIFQPQIRVVLASGTRLLPAEGRLPQDEEGARLAVLYRQRPVMARGFLCSAVWRDIDPGLPFQGSPDFPDCLVHPPFGWPDGSILSEEQYRRFAVPDVRSEFMPVYAVPFPEMGWPAEYGPPPELNSSRLAEAYDPQALDEYLSPLVKGYRRWLKKQTLQMVTLPSREQKLVDPLWNQCASVMKRMMRSLDLLRSDDDVRLAFCFAAKAMSLQAMWSRGRDLVWRPFQLGYILTVLESVADPGSPHRTTCDLLWVPTGAGKTEAYLFLIAFTLALRRRRALRAGRPGDGVAVIMRYTLRLLTIQQFRRLLRLITACEYLRVQWEPGSGTVGWVPPGYSGTKGWIWGSTPFSAGLWVGGGVTPNRLKGFGTGSGFLNGALEILRGAAGEGEPAQIMTCPACGSVLSVPPTGAGFRLELHLVVRVNAGKDELQRAVQKLRGLEEHGIRVADAGVVPLSQWPFAVLSLNLQGSRPIGERDVDMLWKAAQEHLSGKVSLVPARASRPGYFIRYYTTQGQRVREFDFDIFCPAPGCPLRLPGGWAAGAPAGRVHGTRPHADGPTVVEDLPRLTDGNRLVEVTDPFRLRGNPYMADRVPIPALTVDEQVYHRLPSVVVATVDKFARLAFEPRAAALFGNVDRYHAVWGYYRHGCPPVSAYPSGGHPCPTKAAGQNLWRAITPPEPPELVVQDELHLIEGPLGSLVGFYETALDFLIREQGAHPPKYIASTATVRSADPQVQALFARQLSVFPPPCLTIDDRFFIREYEAHPLDDRLPGRLYLGVCAPGRGPLTPLYRMAARLLQTADEVRRTAGSAAANPWWTLTMYFNAIRELAGARALYRQDIPEQLIALAGEAARPLPDDRAVELSSRISSTALPAILEQLGANCPDAPDALFTTSMFGTGVDIPRLSLMVVNGQPKTTAAYIQATGRVGRQHGGLVVTFLRATRPRDLNHYEFFCGYHRQLHRFVEPVTVFPFAPGVVDRAAGPVAVAILRSMRNSTVPWHLENAACLMSEHRMSKEVRQLVEIFTVRERVQPTYRHYPGGEHRLAETLNAALDLWQNVARRCGDRLRYVEYTLNSAPQHPVVLGDPAHLYQGNLDVVYPDAPQSLRDVEDTCTFET